MLMLKAILTAASLFATPVADVDTDAPDKCISAEAITKAFTDHQLTVTKLEGEKLAAFNQAYEAQFHRPAPDGVTSILLIERGPATQIMTFNEANCLQSVGRAPTELVQKLLQAGE